MFVFGFGHAFSGGKKTGTHVNKVGASGDSAGHAVAVADPPANDDHAVEEIADGRDERERGQVSGVAARAGRHARQTICAHGCSLAGQPDGDHVSNHSAAVPLNYLNHWPRRSERRDDHLWFVFADEAEVFRQTGITAVSHDVGGPRRCRCR